MFNLPPIPSWNAVHPLIIHFPVALLLITPIFIVMGAALQPKQGRPYLITAMVLLWAGTAGIFAAVESGETAAELAHRLPRMEQVLEIHESLAHRARIVFIVLSILFSGLLSLPKVLKKAESRLATTILPMAFLMMYVPATLLLVNTAHNGGRLVHEFGIRATQFSALEDAKTVVPGTGVVPNNADERRLMLEPELRERSFMDIVTEFRNLSFEENSYGTPK